MNVKFELGENEKKALEEWRVKHESECTWEARMYGQRYFGAAGGGESFIFTPTGLGLCVSVQCACGAKQDITDISCW